jgi:lysophospholipase L1-like esterase
MVISHVASIVRRHFPNVCLSMGVAFCGLLFAAPLNAANPAAQSPWVATWGASMVATQHGHAADVTGKTLREIVHSTVGGSQARVWLSNRFGSQPLHVGAAHIAVASDETFGTIVEENGRDRTPDKSGIRAGTDRTLTFNGKDSVVIPPGAAAVSDPVALDVPPLTDLAVSIYFPKHTMAKTEHSYADQISYAATGNLVGAPNLAGKSWTERSWYFLTGVDVYAPGDSAVVAFGDSITDGAESTLNENRRWPDDLAARLAADPATKQAGVLGVVNSGIGGNRVLLDGFGPNALARVNWDILARSGARYLIILESINDIGRYVTDHQPYGNLAERLETGLAQIATEAHQHGFLVFGATLTPYLVAGYSSPDGEEVREAVNQWIRTSHTFDGVVDFDKAVRDPQNPLHYASQYDSGDHLHPNDAGYKAMANSIDLSLFTKKR